MNLTPWLLAALLPCTALAAGGDSAALSISSSSFTDGGVLGLQQVGPDPPAAPVRGAHRSLAGRTCLMARNHWPW